MTNASRLVCRLAPIAAAMLLAASPAGAQNLGNGDAAYAVRHHKDHFAHAGLGAGGAIDCRHRGLRRPPRVADRQAYGEPACDRHVETAENPAAPLAVFGPQAAASSNFGLYSPLECLIDGDDLGDLAGCEVNGPPPGRLALSRLVRVVLELDVLKLPLPRFHIVTPAIWVPSVTAAPPHTAVFVPGVFVPTIGVPGLPRVSVPGVPVLLTAFPLTPVLRLALSLAPPASYPGVAVPGVAGPRIGFPAGLKAGLNVLAAAVPPPQSPPPVPTVPGAPRVIAGVPASLLGGLLVLDGIPYAVVRPPLSQTPGVTGVMLVPVQTPLPPVPPANKTPPRVAAIALAPGAMPPVGMPPVVTPPGVAPAATPVLTPVLAAPLPPVANPPSTYAEVQTPTVANLAPPPPGVGPTGIPGTPFAPEPSPPPVPSAAAPNAPNAAAPVPTTVSVAIPAAPLAAGVTLPPAQTVTAASPPAAPSALAEIPALAVASPGPPPLSVQPAASPAPPVAVHQNLVPNILGAARAQAGAPPSPQAAPAMAFQIMAPGVPGGPIIFVDGVAFSPATAAYQAPVAGGVLTAPSPSPPVVRWSTNSPSAAAFAGASGPATVPPAITGPYLGPPSLAAANAPFTTVIVTCCVTWASAAPFALIPNIAGAPNVAGPSGVIVPMAQGVVPGIATLAVPSIVLAVSNTNGIAGNFSASVIYRTAR